MTMFTLTTPAPWMADALCAQVGGEFWFPEPGDSRCADKARRVCQSCPVRDLCLQHALDTNEPDGIWGGLTPTARRRLKVAA